MTLSCPSSTCPLCTGAACNTCSSSLNIDDTVRCAHASDERHLRIRPTRDLTHGDYDEVVVVPLEDVDMRRPDPSRTPTRPLKPTSCRVEIELERGDSTERLATLFELIARLMREDGAVVVSVERRCHT